MIMICRPMEVTLLFLLAGRTPEGLALSISEEEVPALSQQCTTFTFCRACLWCSSEHHQTCPEGLHTQLPSVWVENGTWQGKRQQGRPDT
jgi:hypothetical protein